MKKISLVALAATVALSAPTFALAAMDHGGMKMDHGGMKMEHGSTGIAHEQVVQGVKGTFKVTPMAEAMKAMGMEMPKGVKETHHIAASFADIKGGKAITEGQARMKVIAPDKTAQTKDLMAMHGHFGGDFIMTQKGKYGIMARFKDKAGKIRDYKFTYLMK